MTTQLVVAVVLSALCGYRLARLIALDTITNPMRHWFYRRSYMGDMVEPKSKGSALIYDLISCPHCVGVWMCGLTFLVYALAVDLETSIWVQLIGAGAAMGLQSYMVSRVGE